MLQCLKEAQKSNTFDMMFKLTFLSYIIVIIFLFYKIVN